MRASDDWSSMTCPCGAVMPCRGTGQVTKATNYYAQPIEMYSIALDTPKQIADFKRHAPDVAVSTDRRDPMYGVPVAHSRSAKLQALRAVGYEERN